MNGRLVVRHEGFRDGRKGVGCTTRRLRGPKCVWSKGKVEGNGENVEVIGVER